MGDINIRTLGYFIFRVLTNMIRLLNKELTREGLGIQYPQFAIMMVLSKKESLTQSEMTEIVDRDKAAVSRNISFLEEIGYVERRFDGGKKKRLYLSRKGKEIIPSLYRIANQNKETVLQGFSEEEKIFVMNSLEKMFLNLNMALDEKTIDEK